MTELNNYPQLCGLLIVIIAVLLIVNGLTVELYKSKIKELKTDVILKMGTIKHQSDLIANLSKKIQKLENNGTDKIQN